jgi:hypothetical protein
VHARVDARRTDQDRERDGEAQEEQLHPPGLVHAGQEGPERQEGHGGEHRVPGREARRVDLGRVRDEIGPRSLEAELQERADHHAAPN